MKVLEKSSSLNDLENFVSEVHDFLGGCRIILLKGDLASGKTTFVQKFAQHLGIDVDVTSPTFSVQNEYDKKLYHYDIYQNGVSGFIAQGLLEELDKNGWHMIEWGDEKMEKILDSYFIDYAIIEITKLDQKTRKYKCIH
ncbi:MAG: tRNA (adenosine(37)-N6)-threonylcarbamoyltransferase complex ATPase subunit type 1 TsaE [Sulfurospirillaceae bacterium]|nr:tRNA (adenosine(37)-N6)-threonylcarbamoyltransferase complex ATPase subunit type 1 TsaE [Sulfurospirillaceae bacterium]